MRRALLLGALLVLTPPEALADDDPQKRLADLLVAMMDARTRPTTADTVERLGREIDALVREFATPDDRDFYRRGLDELALRVLRAHHPDRAPACEAEARRRHVQSTRAVLKAIREGLEHHYLNHGRYATTGEGLAILFTWGDTGGPFLERWVPVKDAWGRWFVYRYPGTRGRGEYDLLASTPSPRRSTSFSGRSPNQWLSGPVRFTRTADTPRSTPQPSTS